MDMHCAKSIGLFLLLTVCWTEETRGQDVDHPKSITAQQVFDDLVRAIGDGRTPPQLRLLPHRSQESMQVAWFQPNAHTVTLEERAYDVCASLGADSLHALAWVLGHELAHCYQDHGWVGDFGNGFSDLEVGQTVQALDQYIEKLLEREIQADYFGGFFGYVAGYNTLGVGPEALVRIYGEYGLEDDLQGYPSLVERQEIARRSEKQVRELVPVFEAGRYCLLVKRYEEAGRCFGHVGRTFPSREVLNNAGVACALEALELFEAGEVRFAYPFELDAATRLRGDWRPQGRASGRNRRRERLLQEARGWFERAHGKDPEYVPADINLAGVAALQGKVEEAVFLAGRAVELARNSGERISLAYALIMYGIARFNENPAALAAVRHDFAEALDGAPALVRINLTVLDVDVPAEQEADESGRASDRREQIAGREAGDYQEIIQTPDAVVAVPQADRRQRPIEIYVRGEEFGDWLVVEKGLDLLAFLQTRQGYQGQTARGIRIGQPLNRVEELYGPPAYRVAGRQGTYHVYDNARIIFQAGADGAVQGWILYESD